MKVVGLIFLICGLFIGFIWVKYDVSSGIEDQKNYEVNKKARSHQTYAFAAGVISVEQISPWINKIIEYKKDGEIDEFSDPRDIVLRGYGDCDDFSILYMNILYTELGINESEIVFVNIDHKKVKEYGVNHAIIRVDGELIEPQTGMEVFYLDSEIGLSYSFNEVFSEGAY